MKVSNDTETRLLPKMANRHGFIAGATGTGKTVTLRLLAEQFSEMGVPVFLADVKGDLSGLGASNLPVAFWDVYSETGVPFHSTVKRYSPLLLSKLLSLSETQASILSIVMHMEGSEKLRNLHDLKIMLLNLVSGRNNERVIAQIGNLSTVSVSTLIRKIQAFQTEGGDEFFSGKQLDVQDLFTVVEGKGVINILDATKLMHQPSLYTTSLMWLLNEMYTTLPEVGDLEKPKMVFFFDEAHLLFNDCPKILLQTIERVIKLIRSKGVGVYFITQSPRDIPDSILAQLGNRFQHALRAYTPKEFEAVKIAAKTFRESPEFDTQEEITQLKIGEALISLLDEQGAPGIVEKVKIMRSPNRIDVLPESKRLQLIKEGALLKKYVLEDTSVIKKQAEEDTWGEAFLFVAKVIPYLMLFFVLALLKIITWACVSSGKKR